jgi:DNA-binding MarR family transcriptional regulator
MVSVPFTDSNGWLNSTVTEGSAQGREEILERFAAEVTDLTGLRPGDRRARILALMRTLSEAMEGLQDDYADAVGLHKTDLSAVAHLHEAPEPLTMRALSQRLQLTPGAVTGLVDRLERAGHVTRVPDPHDRRRTRLRLTPDALGLSERFFRQFGRRALRVLAQFDDVELAVIERFLAEIPAALDPTGHPLPEDAQD